MICIDVDRHDGGPDGMEEFERWQVEHGPFPVAPYQETGSGGRQYFYRVDREVKNVRSNLGIDVRGDGGYCVAPPSVHPNGNEYEWVLSLDDVDVPDASPAIYAFIDHLREYSGGHDPNHPSERFSLPQTIGSGGRNDTLFRYAASLRSTGRDETEMSILVRAANRDRCKPPLPDGDVDKIIRSACGYEQGSGLARRTPPGGAGADAGSILDIDPATDAKAKPQKLTVMEICVMLSSDKAICDSIKYDVHDRREWKVGPLPWDRSTIARPLEDRDTVMLYSLMEYGRGVTSKTAFDLAFSQYTALPQTQYDPIADRMAKLPMVRADFDGPEWPEQCEVSLDGGQTWSVEPTQARMLLTLVGAPMDRYTCEVSLLMARQIVSRALRPGCKADSMVVLTGAQGVGKSTFTRLLALEDRFYLGDFAQFSDEDKRRLIGKLVAEVSELDGFGRADMSTVKALVTESRDTVRFPYERRAVDIPRTSVFIGTTNEGGFLTDTTGNRRFLPVTCLNHACQTDPRLFDGRGRAMVEQAYGEVIAYNKAVGEQRALTLTLPADVMQQVTEVQAQYEQEDYTLTSVQSYLDSLSTGTDTVNVKMVMIEGMGYNSESFAREKRYIKADVGRALDKAVGWHRMDGKARIPHYGISRAWRRVDRLGLG